MKDMKEVTDKATRVAVEILHALVVGADVAVDTSSIYDVKLNLSPYSAAYAVKSVSLSCDIDGGYYIDVDDATCELGHDKDEFLNQTINICNAIVNTTLSVEKRTVFGIALRKEIVISKRQAMRS